MSAEVWISGTTTGLRKLIRTTSGATAAVGLARTVAVDVLVGDGVAVGVKMLVGVGVKELVAVGVKVLVGTSATPGSRPEAISTSP